MVFDAVCARSAHDVWARSPAANQRRIYNVKKKLVVYLANIVHALRCSDEARAMFGAFSHALMESDKDGRYRSSLYEVPGTGPNSTPLHLMSLLARMRRTSPDMSWKSFAFYGLIVWMLATVVMLLLAGMWTTVTQGTSYIDNYVDGAIALGGFCMLGYFATAYLHDYHTLKIVGDYKTMLIDFYESLVVADVRASWVEGSGWVFSLDQIADVKKKAESYLESWALWIVYNEFLDAHSDETCISRLKLKRYYNALERIGLVRGGFDPLYHVARDRFQAECAPCAASSLVVGSKPHIANPPNKPESRLMSERS